MGIALLFDKLTELGGAERAAMIMAKELKADVFTTHVNWDIVDKEFKKINVNEISLNFKNNSLLTYTETALKFWNIELQKNYDCYLFYRIFSIAASKKYHPNIWLCNTPPRAIYDLHESINNRLNVLKRPIFNSWCYLYRSLDQNFVKNIDKILSISNNVSKRIKKYYKRNSKIVYLPIETKKHYCKKYEDFYLAPGRLEFEKRFDLIIEAFKHIPNKKLKIAGDGSQREKLEKLAKNCENIEFLGSLKSKDLFDLYSRCTATIYMPINEDLGLIPIESMASGKPCIAADEGGCKETVLHNKTGFLIKPTKKEIVKNVMNLTPEKSKSMKKSCIKRAEQFDVKVFIKKIKKELDVV
jgi:glycosyltransferase involved in cell wall biosynthesis